jgi:hypothetical protein
VGAKEISKKGQILNRFNIVGHIIQLPDKKASTESCAPEPALQKDHSLDAIQAHVLRARAVLK